MSFLDQLNKGIADLEEKIRATRRKSSVIENELRQHGSAVIDLEDQLEEIQKEINELIKEKKELEKHAKEYPSN